MPFRIWAFFQAIAVVFTLVWLTSCSPLDLVCGSARPAPVITSISPSTATLAQVQAGLDLTVNGSHFVVASVVIVDGTELTTTIVSAQQLKVTITSALITQAGSSTVSVHTPQGTSGDIGCKSGGDSSTLTLTIT